MGEVNTIIALPCDSNASAALHDVRVSAHDGLDDQAARVDAGLYRGAVG